MIESRGVMLREPTRRDIPRMWEMENGARAGSWRTGGTTLSLPEYEDVIWQGVLHQWLIVRSTDPDHLCGVALTYDYNPWDGICRFGFTSYSDQGRSATVGAALAIEYLFQTIPIRKVYLDVTEPFPETNKFGRFLSKVGNHEGTVDRFRFENGEWQCMNIWSIARPIWTSDGVTQLSRLLRR